MCLVKQYSLSSFRYLRMTPPLLHTSSHRPGAERGALKTMELTEEPLQLHHSVDTVEFLHLVGTVITRTSSRLIILTPPPPSSFYRLPLPRMDRSVPLPLMRRCNLLSPPGPWGTQERLTFLMSSSKGSDTNACPLSWTQQNLHIGLNSLH